MQSISLEVRTRAVLGKGRLHSCVGSLQVSQELYSSEKQAVPPWVFFFFLFFFCDLDCVVVTGPVV